MITEELTEVYEYGFQCFLEFSLSTLCSIIIAIFLNMLPECLFFFLIFIPMRSFGGGVHMKTYLACFIGSCLLLTSTMLAVKYLSVPIYFSLGLYIISAILVMIIGPVNHPNREVDCQRTIPSCGRHTSHCYSALYVLYFLFTLNLQDICFFKHSCFLLYL